MADGIEKVIVSRYAKGKSHSDIQDQIREVYNFDISTSTLSRTTEKVAADIVAWENRSSQPVHLIVWMDGIVLIIRGSSKVINKTV